MLHAGMEVKEESIKEKILQTVQNNNIQNFDAKDSKKPSCLVIDGLDLKEKESKTML